MRWRPAGAPDPADELLRRADASPGIELGELVRGFAVDAHRLARHTRAKQPARLDAAHRRALRQRTAIFAAWPDWLQRGPGDRLVLDPGNRFLQVHQLPSPAELASPALRRWLRAITALQWYTPAAAVELSDPDGRYAYIPLDAAPTLSLLWLLAGDGAQLGLVLDPPARRELLPYALTWGLGSAPGRAVMSCPRCSSASTCHIPRPPRTENAGAEEQAR